MNKYIYVVYTLNLSEYNDRMGPRNVFVSVCRCELLRDIHRNYSTYNPMTHKRRRVSSRHLYTQKFVLATVHSYILYMYTDQLIGRLTQPTVITRYADVVIYTWSCINTYIFSFKYNEIEVGRRTDEIVQCCTHSYNFTRIYIYSERDRERALERNILKESALYFALSMNMWIMFYTLSLFNKKKSELTMWYAYEYERNQYS